MANGSSIGRTTTIRGSVHGEGDLEIQGRVDGGVTVTGELVIAEGALIKSDVSARRIIVRGAVAGNLTAEESLVLETGARVVGDLGAPQIGIRPGALVRGNVSTGGGAAPARTARAARTEHVRAPAAQPSRAAHVHAHAASAEDGRARIATQPKAAPSRPGPPPPIVPALKKGARASFKRKGAR